MAEWLRIGEVAQAIGVSVDTLRRWETPGRPHFDRQNNQRVLAAAGLEPLMASLSGATGTSSARNRSIERETVMTKVAMACGDFCFVSLLSREAVDEMGLEVGSSATAVVKATNVILEA